MYETQIQNFPWGDGLAGFEPELRRDWSSRNAKTPWERAMDSVRETWEDTGRR